MIEIDREMRGAMKRIIRETNERTSQAWTTVYIDRHKKMPELKKLMVSTEPVRRQTADEMLTIAKQMFVAFGGDPAELSLNG